MIAYRAGEFDNRILNGTKRTKRFVKNGYAQAPTPAHRDDVTVAKPVVWGVLLIPALARLLLHILTSGRFGMFRDEYYYHACAARPAWGCVDQPPLSIWLLVLWKAVFGDSVHSIRVLPALCGSGLIVLTGAASAELGGGRWAQLLAGLAAGVGAAGLVICGFYSDRRFSPWAASSESVVGSGGDRRGVLPSDGRPGLTSAFDAPIFSIPIPIV